MEAVFLWAIFISWVFAILFIGALVADMVITPLIEKARRND